MAKRLRFYFVGLAIGTLVGLGLSYLTGKHGLLGWLATSANLGNIGGVLALAWAQYRGIVPSPEEASRPLSLFPPVEKQQPKR
jgi:hypothetical protein